MYCRICGKLIDVAEFYEMSDSISMPGAMGLCFHHFRWLSREFPDNDLTDDDIMRISFDIEEHYDSRNAEED